MERQEANRWQCPKCGRELMENRSDLTVEERQRMRAWIEERFMFAGQPRREKKEHVAKEIRQLERAIKAIRALLALWQGKPSRPDKPAPEPLRWDAMQLFSRPLEEAIPRLTWRLSLVQPTVKRPIEGEILYNLAHTVRHHKGRQKGKPDFVTIAQLCPELGVGPDGLQDRYSELKKHPVPLDEELLAIVKSPLSALDPVLKPLDERVEEVLERETQRR